MQSDWANNDNDWQLKKLQLDSLKTAEKVVEVLRETIEKEVLTLGKDYERLFGSHSAQFTEYLTMVAQKLEQHGVQHADVINWLNSAARDGSVPSDYASDLRDSQSKTVPFIPGGPMQELVEQNLFDRSLGTQGVASPRPGMAAIQAADIDFSQTAPHGNGGGNGHLVNHNQTHLPAQAGPIPPHTPVSMPLPPRPQPMAQTAPMPRQQNVQASAPSQPAVVPMPPAPPQMQQPQPQYSAPQQSQFSQAAQGAAPAMRREDKKDEDKYVFDPFTAWD